MSERIRTRDVQRVLIYRQGSLGDAAVALPCFHLIEQAFPNAERRLLTNVAVSSVVASTADLFLGAGLIDDTVEYPVETRSAKALFRLARRIRAWKPDVVVYLVLARSRRQRLRDLAYFKLCGVRRCVGLQIREDTATSRAVGPDGMRETETRRLLRAIRELGDVDVDNALNWDLRLTESEKATAKETTESTSAGSKYMVFSIGTKWQPNDYEDENWTKVIRDLGIRRPDVLLVAIGAGSESARSERLLNEWTGRSLNLCGKLQVRQSAAVLSGAAMFLGHDSGPMHLAATVGTPCAAVFSARNPPGMWFPHGSNHRVFYNRVGCAECGLSECIIEQKRCIRGINPIDVVEACVQLLDSDSPT